MGKIIVHIHSFMRELGLLDEFIIPTSNLEHSGFIDFSVTSMKGDERCDIPTLCMYMRDDYRPVEFEMTWDEIGRLYDKLGRFLDQRS